MTDERDCTEGVDAAVIAHCTEHDAPVGLVEEPGGFPPIGRSPMAVTALGRDAAAGRHSHDRRCALAALLAAG